MNKKMLEDIGFGIVVKPNEKYSPILEVFMINELPEVSGDVTQPIVINTDNGTLEGKATTLVTWLPIHEPNRLTAPNMFTHDIVTLKKFVGTDTIIWTPLVYNNKLAKKEAVIYTFSNIPLKKEEDVTEHNSIWFEVNTIDGFIHLSVPNNNNEPAKFNLNWDMTKGVLDIDLDNGNKLNWISPKQTLTLDVPNTVNLNTTTVNVEAKKNAYVHSPDVVVDSSKVHIIGTTTIDGNTTVNGSFKLNGSLRCSGSGKFSGSLNASTTPYS